MTALQIAVRLVLLAVSCGSLIALSIGAARLRDRFVYEPVCTPICGVRSMRYEGVRQYAKSDAAAACRCVSPSGERDTVPTRFFSEIGVVDFFAREATSTLGLVVFLGLGGCAVAVGVGAARRRA